MTPAMRQRVTEKLQERVNWRCRASAKIGLESRRLLSHGGSILIGLGPTITPPQAEACGYHVWQTQYGHIWFVTHDGKYQPETQFRSQREALAAVSDLLIMFGWLLNEGEVA